MSRCTRRVQGIKRDIDAGNMGGNFTVHLLYFVATRTHVNFTWGRTGNEEWKVETTVTTEVQVLQTLLPTLGL